MSYESVNIDALLGDFILDMEAGLTGNVKSMLMIPTFMEIKNTITANERVIVMDAGGTNFRIATLYFDENGKHHIEHFEKQPMPGSRSPISLDEFLNTVVDYMEPVMDASDKVGFSFSFPTEILPNLDGKLLNFTKETRVHDSDGMIIGASVNRTLVARGFTPKKFVLLNDTVAAMFSGATRQPGKQYSGYIGLILGTGTNTCYIEKTENIPKIDAAPGAMAINMESGGYSGITQGDFDIQLDQQTHNPGEHIYEKMISGAYQGRLVYLTLLGAAEEGLFSPAFAQFLRNQRDIGLKDLNQFCSQPFGDHLLAQAVAGSDSDRQTLYAIIDANFERVARVMAVNIGGILIKTDTGQDPTRPVCVVGEGTAFQHSELFRKKLDFYIAQDFNAKRNRYCEFISTEDATLIGSAAACLMN